VRLEPLPPLLFAPLVEAALREDLGLGGDLTSEATVPAELVATAAFVARVPGVLAGLDVALFAIRTLDPEARFDVRLRDGEPLVSGATIAIVTARARALLAAERTALNLLSHLSGIATATARAVAAVDAAVGPGRCAVTETRKTLPGLRALQKYAVRAGGGRNHRLRLDDAMIIKDNHVALAGGVGVALSRARERAGHLVKMEIEVDSLDQLREVLASAALPDVILLDNFTPARLGEAVALAAGRVVLEASGTIDATTIAEVARSGVDVISSGALTHSVAALDIGLDIGS